MTYAEKFRWELEPLYTLSEKVGAYRMPRPQYHAMIETCLNVAEMLLKLPGDTLREGIFFRDRFSRDAIMVVRSEARAYYPASPLIVLPAETVTILRKFWNDPAPALNELVAAIETELNAGTLPLAEAVHDLNLIREATRSHGFTIDTNIDLTPAFRRAARQANEGSPFLQRLLSRAPASA